jgi:hypothetical protein
VSDHGTVAVTSFPDDGDDDANARLIAAAPDLLAAVRARTLARDEAKAISDAHPDGEKIPAHLISRVEWLFSKAAALEAAALAKACREA